MPQLRFCLTEPVNAPTAYQQPPLSHLPALVVTASTLLTDPAALSFSTEGTTLAPQLLLVLPGEPGAEGRGVNAMFSWWDQPPHSLVGQ